MRKQHISNLRLGLVDGLDKTSAWSVRPRLRSVGGWLGREILAPAIPTAVLAVVADRAISGSSFLERGLSRVPALQRLLGKKKRKKSR